MTRTEFLAGLYLVFFLSGCAFGVAGQVQAGRYALLANDTEAALSHFQQATQTDPNYRMASGPFREGVWTYLGRAQYQAGKLAEARQSLERALSLDRDDYLARLYLGLTLARTGERPRALKEIEAAMKGIYDWLEYVNYYTLYGQFWDPSHEMRKRIEQDLAMISREGFDWQKLISDGEWLGRKMEEEIDLARRDERRQREREFDQRSRVFFGIGF